MSNPTPLAPHPAPSAAGSSLRAARPLASVVINNYNYAGYLAEAIDSALAQAYAPKEIIVVDDGSTDGSRAVIDSYGDDVIAVLKENGGQPSAYNAGIAASRGEFVSFLDSDDIWLPGKLEKTVEAMLSDPEIVLAYHRCRKFSSNRVLLDEPWPPCLWQGDIQSRVRRSGGWWPCPASSTLSFRRNFLIRIGRVPEEDRYLADALLSDLAPFFGKVAGIAEVLSHYRVHERNYYLRDLQNDKGDETDRMLLRLMEKRTQLLNRSLARLGRTFRVRGEDNYYLQRLRRKLGHGVGRVRLARLALGFAGESSLRKRVKNFARILLTGG